METKKTPPRMEERDVCSVLEIYDTRTDTRTVLKEFDALIEAPNWTGDGKHLLYNSKGCLFTYALDDGAIEQVDTGFAVYCNNDHVLSPDGKSVAVSHATREDWKSRIYTLPLAGGAPTLLTPMAPSYLHGWSPDGSTLAYCAERNGQYDIYTIPVQGGHERQLTDGVGLDDGPEYSPCGKYIWFNSTRSGLMQVWRMEADGANPTQITFDESNSWFPHLSPDGAQMVYITYRKGDVEPNSHPPNKEVELRLARTDAGNEYRTLVSLFGGQGTINVNSWAPDSKRFAFVSYRLKA